MMNNIIAFRHGLIYEGDDHSLRAIHPLPTITKTHCDFYKRSDGGIPRSMIFREDSFDPVTRIRRGRLYVKNGRGEWPPGRVDHGHYHPYLYGETGPGGSWIADLSYDAWQANDASTQEVNGQIVQIGTHGYVTPWRVVGAERIAIGHILLTLRANSLLGVIPELSDTITDKDGNIIDVKPVQTALGSLVDAFHRQQATPTVDVARETAKVILTAWIGRTVHGDDLGDVIKKIPGNKSLVNWVASIVNRLHPRGKSAEQEKRAANGIVLRPVANEDAEVSVHLIGMLLREIGWVRP